MAYNPLHSNSEGSSFEQGNPLTTAIKKPTQAASDAAIKQAQQQKQSFIDQLYGNVSSAPSEDSPDANGLPQLPQQSQTHGASGQAAALAQQAAQAKTPEEQAQIEEARKKLQELQSHHKSEYYEKTFGEGEQGRKKREQEEEQEKQMKLQEEEEKRQQEEEEKARQAESLAMPSGKGGQKGRNRMSMPPLAVTQSQTKAESNRGTSG